MSERAQNQLKQSSPASFTPVSSGVLQRQCACGNHTVAGGECAECGKKKQTLQRAPFSPRGRGMEGEGEVPPIVHEVLRLPGQPLDTATRAFMEPRFGHDFSQVRVHTDAKAAESAQAVNAVAYTVGRDVVFNRGQYAPSNPTRQRLLAHELTHVIQQRGSPPDPTQTLTIDPSATQEKEAMENALRPENMQESQRSVASAFLQRACLKPDECKTGAGQRAKTEAVVTKPENVGKRKRREQLCQKKPPDPGCTGDGHSGRAVELEKLLFGYQPERRSLIHGIFIDKDIPDDWRAYHGICDEFIPPIDGKKNCIFAPESTEKEAARFNTSKDPTIGGMTRDEWRLLNLRIVVHETGHARFEAAIKAGEVRRPRAGACKFKDIRSELQEIAADMEEFAAMHDLLQRSTVSESERETKLHDTLVGRWIPRARDNWQKIRCVCECDDADKYVQKTVAIMTSRWATDLSIQFHSELRKGIPSWPVEPPKPIPKPSPERRPELERPKFGPLYRPRTDFVREMEKSAEEL